MDQRQRQRHNDNQALVSHIQVPRDRKTSHMGPDRAAKELSCACSSTRVQGTLQGTLHGTERQRAGGLLLPGGGIVWHRAPRRRYGMRYAVCGMMWYGMVWQQVAYFDGSLKHILLQQDFGEFCGLVRHTLPK